MKATCPSSPSEPLLVNTATAAEMLNISPRKLWQLTNSGDLPHVRIGRRVLYQPTTLRDWLAQQERIHKS